MVKTTRVAAVAALAGLALGLCLFAVPSPTQAKTTSDQPAAILYWPKIVVDTTGRFTGGTATDTVIRLSNTCAPGIAGNPCANINPAFSPLGGLKQAHCFYIDANSHCSNSPATVCQTGADCGLGGSCLPGWSETDFDIILTKEQPLAWHASAGLGRGHHCSNNVNATCETDADCRVPLAVDGVLADGTCVGLPLQVPGICHLPPRNFCTSDAQCNGGCDRQQSNLGSGIPPVPENPFVGSLVCIEFDPSASPPVPDQEPTTNTLKGEATIEGTPVRAIGLVVDLASYNAVGVKYVGPAGGVPGAPPDQLLLDGVQYDSCPTTLILDHLFDSPGIGQTTDLTLIPCGNDFLTQTPGSATAQFIVFNEFEQRFSTSRLVDCFLESALSNLDTPDPSRSIFSISVSGTVAGQTRIHPVGNAATGRGLVGVARLLVPGASAAYNLHQAGSPVAPATQPDVITIP